jgi:16S rRNA processing protein RimM
VDSTHAVAETEPAEDEVIVVGRLVRPHGVRGEHKLEVLSDNPERFEKGNELLLGFPWRDGRPGYRLPLRVVRVRAYRQVRGGALIGFEGCDSREDAEMWRNGELSVERSDVPAAPEGLHYYFELVGCRCRDREAGELGEVVEVVEDGGGHLLRLQQLDRELLVPFVDAFVERLDVEAREMDLRLPPGLVEICGSGF